MFVTRQLWALYRGWRFIIGIVFKEIGTSQKVASHQGWHYIQCRYIEVLLYQLLSISLKIWDTGNARSHCAWIRRIIRVYFETNASALVTLLAIVKSGWCIAQRDLIAHEASQILRMFHQLTTNCAIETALPPRLLTRYVMVSARSMTCRMSTSTPCPCITSSISSMMVLRAASMPNTCATSRMLLHRVRWPSTPGVAITAPRRSPSTKSTKLGREPASSRWIMARRTVGRPLIITESSITLKDCR